MNHTAERLAQCFVTAFPKLNEAEARRAVYSALPEWDSLGTLTLVGLIEEEFGLQIPPDDLAQFLSFELIYDYIEGRAQ